METLMTVKRLLIATATLGLLAACGSDTGFGLDTEQNLFQQSVTRTQVKVDILWVVDNSGSMMTSQNNVAANFQSFIEKFQETNFDYQMAVTTTDAWRSNLVADPDEAYKLARFRDGTDATVRTGVTVLKPDTPDLQATFIANIQQGVEGSGDERGFQSLQTALSFQDNLDEPFPREDSLLAVIFLSDEADGSTQADDPGNDPDWFADKEYFDFLLAATNSTAEAPNFMVNTIGILDQTCLDELTSEFLGRGIAERYINMSDRTGGYKGSLCDDFTDVMSGITDLIIEKSTAFTLSRPPAVDTIVVTINGEIIPMDADNGWTYDPNSMLVTFHGSAIPGSDAVVSITYDPATLK